MIRKRPFLIAVGDRQVRVVGTEFNISHHDGQTALTVRRGIVDVRPLDQPTAEPTRLFVGQQLRHRDGAPTSTVSSVEPDSAFAWTQGQLVYRDAPLSEVACRPQPPLPPAGPHRRRSHRGDALHRRAGGRQRGSGAAPPRGLCARQGRAGARGGRASATLRSVVRRSGKLRLPPTQLGFGRNDVVPRQRRGLLASGDLKLEDHDLFVAEGGLGHGQ
jgi:hypothetical protein